MAVKPSRVTVTTAATLLTPPTTDAKPGSSVLVRPAADVYIGGPGVTTATGYLVAGGSELAMDLNSGETLHAVAAAGSVSVSVLRTGA